MRSSIAAFALFTSLSGPAYATIYDFHGELNPYSYNGRPIPGTTFDFSLDTAKAVIYEPPAYYMTETEFFNVPITTDISNLHIVNSYTVGVTANIIQSSASYLYNEDGLSTGVGTNLTFRLGTIPIFDEFAMPPQPGLLTVSVHTLIPVPAPWTVLALCLVATASLRRREPVDRSMNARRLGPRRRLCCRSPRS